jgi:hypothetical protein
MTLLAFAAPAAASPCPAGVTAAVLKAHAGAAIERCKAETEYGKLKYEVEIVPKGGKRLELEVDTKGTILLTEESVDLAVVPPAVMNAFAAQFPGAKATRAVKQTDADGNVSYELSFGAGAAEKDATFTEDGAPVEDLDDPDDEEGQD